MRHRQNQQPLAQNLVDEAVREPPGREGPNPFRVRPSDVGKLSKEPDETLNVVKEIGAEAGRTRFVEL